jgi:hypothetical protein
MFLPAKKQQESTKALTAPAEAEAATLAPAKTDLRSSFDKACEQDGGLHNTSPSHKHHQQPSGAPTDSGRSNTGGATHLEHPNSERSKSLDITKVRPGYSVHASPALAPAACGATT